MKISCQSCQAKYTIADEKVAGKTVKIKCKKCGTTIVVHGDQGGGGQTLDPNLVLGTGGGDEDVETRVFAGEGAPGGSDEWTVNVSDDDQRTLTTPQIVEGWQSGSLNADTYVWKDGMGDWLPITSVPELMQLIGPGAAGVAPEPQFGLGGTMMMEPASSSVRPSAVAGASAAAAKRAARPGAVDLFGAQPAQAAAGSADAQSAADRLVGERNENSVLFSLSALTATENAARAHSVGPSPNASRAPAPPRPGQNGGQRAGLDDIMNMSGGLSAAPMLAPPPLLAPVIEAPPPPPAQMMGPPSGYAHGMQMNPAQASFAMPMQPQKSKTGLIVGIIAAVLVLGAVGAFLATRSGPEPTASNDAASANAATAAAPSSAPAAPSGAAAMPSAAASAAPEASAAAADTGSPSDSAAEAKNDAKGSNAGKGRVSGPLPKEASKKEEKAEKKEEAPKEEPKKKEEAPAAGGGGEFNRSAATSALGAAAGAARRCAKPDGPTGSGRVKVTFAPSGNVTSATVEGPPFAGTAVGGCIAGAFRGAHIPAFEGSPVSVTKSFSVN